MSYPYNNITPLDERRWILQYEGQFVERVDNSTSTSSIGSMFHFTNDRSKAQEFSFNDLWNPRSIKPPGVQFTEGFSRGKAVRVR